MESSKRHYKRLDLLRLISCIFVFLYHLNIVKGGFLAVCIFFVLSGYLSTISLFKKDKINIFDYYKNRLKHIYLPLAIVVFSTIAIMSLFKEINFLNLKPESTSVLLGYNNIWQIDANLDYFARHINSPFMHFWYISILMQFDLVFPILFIIFKKIGEKFGSKIVCIFLIILSVTGALYFYQFSLNNEIMVTYYDTFTRSFSLIFGVTLGFIHSYYSTINNIKNRNIINFIYFLLIISLIIMFFVVDSTSNYYQLSMIIISIISCILIDLSITNDNLNIIDKFIKYISSMTYEIYLIQYPVIFIFQTLEIKLYPVLFIILITIILSILLHISLSKKDKFKFIKYLLFIIFLVISLYGIYQFGITKDHTKEMRALEQELLENEKMMEERQKAYALKLEEEEKKWNSKFQSLEDDLDSFIDNIKNLKVVGVGDSVMLGAIDELYKMFPNGYFDAKKSRTAWVANNILVDLKRKNMLKEPVIFGLGANGDCPESCKNEILNTIGNRKLFWLNASNDYEVHINNGIRKFAEKHDNVYVIDWEKISKGHDEYFIADKVHLTEVGTKVYAKAIYDAIKDTYQKEYEVEKEKIEKEREDILKKKVTLYGNDLLLNSFKYVRDDFKDDSVKVNDYTYETLKETLIKDITNNTINYNIAFVFDDTLKLSVAEFNDLIKLCSGHRIFIFNYKDIDVINKGDVRIINISDRIENFNEYFIADKIHLNDEGNMKMSKLLLEIKEEKWD